MGRLFLFIGLLFTLQLICSGQGKLYQANKFQKGILDEDEYQKLLTYLSENGRIILKDTIFIKFEFNNESCWDQLDSRNDGDVYYFVNKHQEIISNSKFIHPGSTAFHYRESGSAVNKVISLNDHILIDNGTLRKLLFRKQATCGTSAIILPSRKYLLIKSDAHFKAFSLSSEEIALKLNEH